jgi:hypothetical protein
MPSPGQRQVRMLRHYQCCGRCPELYAGEVYPVVSECDTEIWVSSHGEETPITMLRLGIEFIFTRQDLKVEIAPNAFIGYCRATEACL